MPAQPSVAAAAALAAVMVVVASAGVLARQNVGSQDFTVNAEVVEGCVLIGTTGTSGLDFGILDFGSAPAIVAAELPGSAMTGSLATQLWCTPGLSMQVSVDAGQHASGGQRMLARSGGGQVPYALFVDSGHSVAIPPGGPVGVTAPPGGLIDLPIYGLASVPGGALMPGSYTDTLQVTVSW